MAYNYEMMYILRPDLVEDQINEQINKYKQILEEYNAEDIRIKSWGKRRLAYPIQKFVDGIYIRMNYKAEGEQVAPLEKAMRLSDVVIRYLTIKLDQEPSEDLIPPAVPVSETSQPPRQQTTKPITSMPEPKIKNTEAKSSDEEVSPEVDTSKASETESEVSETESSEAVESEETTTVTETDKPVEVEA